MSERLLLDSGLGIREHGRFARSKGETAPRNGEAS